MNELIMLGQMDNTMDNTHESSNRVYSVDGISPTIPTISGGDIQPKFLEEKLVRQAIETFNNNDCKPGDTINPFNQTVDRSGICPTITTRPEGLKTAILPVVEDKTICAMRGRNPDNPSDRTTGSPTEQRLEPNSEGVSNTLTSVQKDNLVLIKQATKEGAIECKVGGVADLSYPDSTTRRGRVQDKGDTSPTITADGELCRIESRYRIRKLTPRECWRLMGYTDTDFDKAQKVNSNTQLYKQAGNAIVKQVLMAIFRQMNIHQEENI